MGIHLLEIQSKYRSTLRDQRCSLSHLSRVDFIGGVDCMSNKVFSRFIHNLTKLLGSFGYKSISLPHFNTFPTAPVKPIHHFHVYCLHHWAEWLLPCHKKPGVQRFSDIQGVMTVSLTW